MIPHHHCIQCGYDWPIIVEHPKKCPNCQSRKWNAMAEIEKMTDRDLAALIEYGQSHNFPCVLSPAWDKDNVSDLREDIYTSISGGWDWGSLIKNFLNS